MRKIFYTLWLCAQMVLMSTSCTDYLSVPVEADKNTEDIFGDYYNFQGFVDQLYPYVRDPIVQHITYDTTYGGETIGTTGWSTGYNSVRGLYKNFLTRGYLAAETDFSPGIWMIGWDAIRIANLGLENFNLMQGTEDEKNKIRGQLLFMRAFFHQELLAAWGSIPYVDKVLIDEFNLPRFAEYTALDGKTYYGYQACAVRVAEDMQEASELLPVAWNNDVVSRGRCTALAALAYKAKALVYAASPLMSEYSGTALSDLKSATINIDLMRQAAEAASDAIKMADDNSTEYGLLDWEHYSDMFYTVDGSTMPWSKETLWGKYNTLKGNTLILNTLGRIHLPDNSVFGGNGVNCTPTQNYVDLFEMNDGSLYKKEYDGVVYIEDGKQKCKMWDDRDPRFRRAIYVDRDNAGDTDKTILQLYIGGRTRKADNCQTPYYIHKYWPWNCNKTDNGAEYNNMRMMVPLMRLAEVYLLYAEAVFQSTGDANQKIGNCGYTALQAVNKIRERAGQVPTTAAGGDHGDFMKMILNERAVEFCFEGQYWYDIRRYKIGETMSKEAIQTLDFTEDWKNFSRRTLVNRTFDVPKHYWMPFPTELTKMYPEFPQNTGWE